MIMSRSVKSICVCPGPAGAKITCSIIFKITIVVLIIQLHDSLAHPHHYPPDPRLGPNEHPLRNRDSTTFDNYKKSFGLKSRGPHFEFSITKKEHRISKTVNKAPGDIVEIALKTGILSNRAEFEARNRHSGPPSGIFGDERDESAFIPEIPKHCKDKLICNVSMSYPRQHVENMVRSSTDFRELDREDELPNVNELMDKGSVSLCNSLGTVMKPAIVRKDIDEIWHYVVNVENFKQGFYVADCVNANARCGTDLGRSFELPGGHNAICKQQYHLRPMAVVGRNRTIIRSLFPVPSGCCCHFD